MSRFTRLVISLLLLTSSALSESFEQDGVKEGNIKISASLYTQQPNEGDDSVNLNAQVGYFMNGNIETLIGLDIRTRKDDEFDYTISPGVNYYFYKTPFITPFIGSRFYYWNTSFEYQKEEKGVSFYIGTHLFLSENIAISPEFGIDFINFESKKGTYFDTYLTYFF